MGIYDRDYMKRRDPAREDSRRSRMSLADRLDRCGEALFTKHRRLLIGVLIGLGTLGLVAFVGLKLS